MNLGFGTDYEIFIFKKIACDITRRFKIKSSINFPQNKLLGDKQFFPKESKKAKADLVWNFCEFENDKNSREFLKKNVWI